MARSMARSEEHRKISWKVKRAAAAPRRVDERPSGAHRRIAALLPS
jgi:hypothetical protein